MNHSEQRRLWCRNATPPAMRTGRHATNLVFGDGNPDSGIMLIGEGPGEQEDLRRRPLCGSGGGQSLNQMLTSSALTEANIISAIL